MFNLDNRVAGYVNSDYAGDLDKQRSTMGYLFYYGWWTYLLAFNIAVYCCIVYHRSRVYANNGSF